MPYLCRMNVRFYLILLLAVVFAPHAAVVAQDCVGGQIYTNEAFLYGRFETRMKSAAGNGVVSSFFLYNYDVGCNWLTELNEVDIEMTGDDENVQFTTHYPGPVSHTQIVDPNFNPHAAYHYYAIEWEPGIVRWFVDGSLMYVQDQAFVQGLIHPMRIMMNLWAAEAVSWVGPWDPAIMPVESSYDYVRYFAYTPGTGSYGTNNNFTLEWQSDFDSLNTERWTVSPHAGFDGNYCTFKPTSVEFDNGFLYLQLEEDAPSTETVPVTFAVNADSLNLQPNDVVFLNGTFNGWCGNCAPMNEQNGIWTRTEWLPPNEYEYLFTVNLWQQTGGAPVGSACDFHPCDTYGNYGLVISSGDAPVVLEPHCWGQCGTCALDTVPADTTVTDTTSTTVPVLKPSANPTLLKIYDLTGREVPFQRGRVLLFYYDDGTVERKFFLE